ncbi:MAG: DNA primase, partial [Desulfotomaculales bacterium]
QAAESGHMLSLFWNDVSYLVAEKEVDDKYIRATADGYLYIWLQGLYEKWALHYRKKTGREPFDLPSIQKYLREEPCCIDSHATKRFKNGTKKAWVIKLEGAPEIIGEIAEAVGISENQDEV